MKVMLVAALLLAATPALAQERPTFKLPTAIYSGAAAFDVASTAHCLRYTGCHERNPVISGMESSGVVPMLATGEFLDFGANLVLRKLLAPNHPTLYRAILYAVAGFRTVIAARNMAQAREQRVFNISRGIR